MAINYTPINWNTSTTFLNPTNLNKMDGGVKQVSDWADNMEKIIGSVTKSTPTTAGSAVVPAGNTGYDLFNWMALSKGTYLLFARAMNKDGTEFAIQQVDTLGKVIADLARSANVCDIFFPLEVGEGGVILAFRVAGTQSDYTLWNDGRHFSFQAVRLK